MGELQPHDNGDFYASNQGTLVYLREGIHNLVAENTELTSISPYLPGSNLEYPSSRPTHIDYGNQPRQVAQFKPPTEAQSLPDAAISAHATLRYYLRQRFPQHATNPLTFDLATMPSVIQLREVRRIHNAGTFAMRHVVLLANHPDPNVPDSDESYFTPDYQPSLFQSAEFHSLHHESFDGSGDQVRMLTVKDRIVRVNHVGYGRGRQAKFADGVIQFPDIQCLDDIADTVHRIPSQDTEF